MHIGLIGGIGVAATVVYYQRLTKAIAAFGAKPELTIVHADVQTLIHNNNANKKAAQAAIYAPLLDRLQAAGADCAAITSLGGHFCFEETKALSPLPLVSAIAPLDQYFAARGIRHIGILGTRSVMATGFFGQLAQTKPVILRDDLQELGLSYQEMAVAGRCTGSQRREFFDAGARMMKAGAEAVVLAGTDLNLAFDGYNPGFPVIDALDVHVDLLARLGAGDLALDAA